MAIKALALVSGGLDSLLAAKLVSDQGIEVIGIHFRMPFCKLNIKEKFPDIGIRVIEIDLSKDFLSLLKNPRHGFGSNMNPCIDCKILMFAKAKNLLDSFNAKFIATGEVLGQRPMSQNRQAMALIKKESGLDGLLLRPLSARFFPPSLAEINGWVEREKLLKFNGRSRKAQIELARNYGLKGYSTPAGGCLLTDPCFSKRLKELIAHQELSLANLELLKLGRHFRLSAESRLVTGRDERENKFILKLVGPADYLLWPQEDLAGPTCLLRGKNLEKEIPLACQIVSSYTDLNGLKEIEVNFSKAGKPCPEHLRLNCVSKERFSHLLI